MRRISLLVVLLFVFPLPARAEVVRTFDRAGAGGALDMASIAQGNQVNNDFEFVVTTQRNLTESDLRSGRLRLNFDLDRDGFWDRIVTVRWRRGENRKNHLFGEIRDGAGNLVGHADANLRKRSQRRVAIWIDRRDVAFSPGFYEMNVVTRDWGTSCAQDPCRDWLPDTGTIAHHVWPDCFGLDPDRIGSMDGDFMRSAPNRVVFSRGGDDRVEPGRRGSGPVCAGPGEDVVVGGQRVDRISGGPGADHIRGRGAVGGCNDGSCPATRNVILGGPGADWLVGGSGLDKISGSDGNDHLEGRDGSDNLFGGRGRDDLWGGDGRDECHGGEMLHQC